MSKINAKLADQKLKVAVSVFGQIVFLEKLPDTEDFAGINESIEDTQWEFDTEDPPGLYLATLAIETRSGGYYEPPESELVIEKMEALP